MSVDAVLDLITETFARAEWVSLFLGVIGFYWLFLGWSGVAAGHTRGFGWGEIEWTGANARFAGWVWAGAGFSLVIVGIVLWMLKA